MLSAMKFNRCVLVSVAAGALLIGARADAIPFTTAYTDGSNDRVRNSLLLTRVVSIAVRLR